MAAALGISHHRVTRVNGLRVALLGHRHGLDDDIRNIATALVTGDNRIDVVKLAQLIDTLDNLAHIRGRNHRAAPLAVAGVVGEIDGVDRPHFKTCALQREDRSGVAHVAIAHMRLDGQNRGHAVELRDSFSCLFSRGLVFAHTIYIATDARKSHIP